MKKVLLVLPSLILFVIFIVPYFQLDISKEVIKTLSDKLIHFILFGSYSASIIFRSPSLHGRPDNKTAIKLIFYAILLALVDESMQYFIEFRHASVGDLIADISGILVFSWVSMKKEVLDKVETMIER